MRSRVPALDALTSIYEATSDPAAIARMQLDRFNTHWQHAWTNVPFYKAWKTEHRLPDKIDDLNQLAYFPVLTKSVLSERRDLIDRTPGIHRRTLTGGTSGVSTAFPMNEGDASSSWTNTHLGRRWNEIEPDDLLFMIWGHSHLFSGKGAWRKQLTRRAKDLAANIHRMSAYNMSGPEMDKIAAAIRAKRPSYVIGYGSCLAQLCHHLRGSDQHLQDAGVCRIVNTSETMPADDAPLVESIFGCPVINEYGMAEAGVIGYSRGALYPISLFWNDYIVRLVNRRIVLSTLGKRCFPLINYDTEDLSDDPMPESGTVLELRSLLGKARDIFTLCDISGSEHTVSVVLFDHIFKQISELRSLHYTLRADGGVRVDYTAEGALLDPVQLRANFADGLLKEGIRIDPGMTEFNHLDAPLQTQAGKRVTLRREY